MKNFKQFLYEKILFKNKKVKAFGSEIINLKAVINPSLSEIKDDIFLSARGLIRMNGDLILVNSRLNLIHSDIFKVLSIVFSDISKVGRGFINSFEGIINAGALPVHRKFDTDVIFLGESVNIGKNDEGLIEILNKARKKSPSLKFFPRRIT